MQGIGEGTVLAGRYALTHKLAERDDQELWLARDTTLDREVTATVFRASFPHADAALDSARRAAGVEDPHLPRVLDVSAQGDTAFVITEALRGAESIAAMLQFDPLPAEEVRRMVGEAANGLAAAAARGLHHLRLTPHDIVRSPDGAVSVLGLPADAALAGADDVSSDEASRQDAVALVQIVYAGLTGRWPGKDAVPGVESVARRADGELPAPSELVGGVPGDLDTLCRTTLGADQGPRTPRDLARQLAPWSSDRVDGGARRSAGGNGTSGRLHAVPGGAAAVADVGDAVAGDTGQGTQGDRDEATVAVPVSGTASTSGAATTSAGTDGDAGVSRREPDADETAQIPVQTAAAARARSAAADDHDDQPFGDDDYDPSFTELEPPLPGLSGRFEPDRSSSKIALALVALLVIIAVVLAVIGLRGIGGSSTPAASSTSSASASASGSASSSSASPSSSSSSSSAKAIDPQWISYYGTNGGDNRATVKRAIDDDPDTYWSSYTYNTAAFGGRKTGVGLLINLGSSQSLSSIKITTTGGDSTIKVFVTDSISSVSNQDSAATLTGKGTQTADLNDAKGKYVTIWVTSLSQQSSGGYQERINDIKVYP